MAEFERLKDTVMWSAADDEYLRMAGETLEPQVDDMLDRMYQAWFKSVVLRVTLWSYPYTKDGDW